MLSLYLAIPLLLVCLLTGFTLGTFYAYQGVLKLLEANQREIYRLKQLAHYWHGRAKKGLHYGDLPGDEWKHQ
jgi:hypothetical protein